MTRKKVKLVWIASDNARKASFKKRRMGLIKKVSELTTLCGVYAFAVVYGPDDDQPLIWPSRSVAQELFRRYQSLPELERHKKMMNQETYLRERTSKVQDQLKKHIKKNQEMEMDLLMHQLNQGRQIFELSNAELLGLLWMVEERMRDSRKRIDYHQQVQRLPPPAVGPSPPIPVVNEMDLVESSAGDARNMFDQWFVDMVMNPNDKIGGSSSSMMGELGFQSEANIAGNFNGDLGERRGDGTEGEIGDQNLLSQWNYEQHGSIGMNCEMEKLVSNINGGDDASNLMDFTQQGSFGICGGGSDADLLHGWFEGGINGGDALSKGWSNIFTP